MNITDIKANDVFKNYKALCSTLDINPKAGNSKKAQMKEIERFMKLKQEGYTLIVEEVYETPLPDTRYDSSLSPHIKYQELILLEFLIQQKGWRVIASKTELSKILYFVNSDYYLYRNNTYELSELMKVEIDSVHDFYSSIKNSYSNAIGTIINRLEKAKAIMCNELWKVIENGKTHRIATDSERKKILEITGEVMIKYGGDMKTILKMKLFDSYDKELSARMSKELNLTGTYKVYDIVMNKDALTRLSKQYAIELTGTDLINETQQKWVDTILSNVDKRKDRALSKRLSTPIGEMENLSRIERYRLSKDLKSDYKTLCNKVIIES